MDYFHKISKQTSTRFWVNNPTIEDTRKAIAAGALNATTNPAYCSKLLQGEPEYVLGVIKEVVHETDDDDIAAELVYQRCTKRIMEQFMPLHEKSNGTCGYVTIQDDPRKDRDVDSIIKSAKSCTKLSRNFMAKIPVIPAGIKAMEKLISENIPICATEVFSISQAIHICDVYERVSKKYGVAPPFYVTHITGIFDEHLQLAVKEKAIDISPELLHQAGCIIARKEYFMLKKRGYHATMLGGGARGTHHFTELVGGDLHVTMNWSTAKELIDADNEVLSRIDVKPSRDVIDELREKVKGFRQAYDDDGLSPEDFENFGPVLFFRSSFLKGYYHLLGKIARSRSFA